MPIQAVLYYSNLS